MPREATKLVLGRGEVYFDRFLPGTRTGEGERYLGNTPSFRIQRSIERLERATSYRGRRVAVPGATVAEETSVNFVTDNIDDENLALWFGATPRSTYFTPPNPISESFLVRKGRTYQLGKTVQPFGTPDIAYPAVRLNGSPLGSTGNFVINIATGRIEVFSNALNVNDGDSMEVRFHVRQSNASIIDSTPARLLGALRFVANNKGRNNPQNDYYFPMVDLSPRGQVDLKSDEWQQWAFDATAMNLRPGVEQAYMMRRATVSTMVSDEQAIIEEFGSLAPFPYWDDQLHQIINYDWPPAVDFTGI